MDNRALACYLSYMKKTVNIRIYENTYNTLKKLANNRRQNLIVVIDELVHAKEVTKTLNLSK